MSAPASVLKWSDLQTIFSGNDGGDGSDLLHVDEIFCFNCRKSGHTDAHCPEPRRCFVCLKPTHQGYQCVDNPVQGSVAYKPNERCASCHERGHTAAFCKKPGGGMHSRGGARHLADTVFPRPLVLYVPRDSGPTDAEMKGARADITNVLRQVVHQMGNGGSPVHHGSASAPTTTTLATPSGAPTLAVMVPALQQMRDVEFFCAVLPLLNDPTAHLSPAERSAIKDGLFKMRSAVAGSISLGDTRKGGHGPSSSNRALQHPGDEGDLLYDMRASGLDINVLYGGRLDVFHRTKHNTARMVKGGTVACAAAGTSPVAGGHHGSMDALLHPEKTVAQYVYLSHSARKPTRSKQTVAHPSANKDGGPPAQATERRLQRLTSSLEAIDAQCTTTSGLPTATGGGGVKRTVHPTVAQGPSRGVVSSGGNADPSRTFVAPVPPHMRHHEAVSAQILSEWANDDAAPTTAASRGKPVEDDKHNHVGQPPAANRGVVRRFLSSAKARYHTTQQQAWAKAQPPPQDTEHVCGSAHPTTAAATTERHGGNTAEADGPIMNWNVYHKQQAPTTAVQLFQPVPPATGRHAPVTTSTAEGPSIHMVTARSDVVQQWRSRFEHCKAVDGQRVGASLAQRVMHRQIVASNDQVFAELATAFASGAGRRRRGRAGARSVTSRSSASPSSGSDAGDVPGPNGTSKKPLLRNLWSAKCKGLAVSEAKARLRHAIVDELRAYAARIGLVGVSSGDPSAATTGTTTLPVNATASSDADAFVDSLCRVVLEAPSKHNLLEKAKSIVTAYAPRVKRGAVLLKRVSRVAIALFDEMEIAQTDANDM